MKRGPKPSKRVKILWTRKFAYAVGLMVADGYVSKDGRHISFTSKDKELVDAFNYCLALDLKVSTKLSGAGRTSYFSQFSDVNFHQFLTQIGVHNAKSLTIKKVAMPEKYFNDFFRGYFDGDGSAYAYHDSVYKNSFRFYLSFTSGSKEYLLWLQKMCHKHYGVKGYISTNRNNKYTQLKFSKYDAILICEKMYYKTSIPALERKREKVQSALRVIEECRSGEIGRRATFRA